MLARKPSHEVVIEHDEDKTIPDLPFFRHAPSPAQIQAFERFATKVTAQGVQGVWKEFDHLRNYSNHTNIAFDANQAKNRYRDVVCGDAGRVILPDNGYIHANYVKGSPLYLPFILCQGPLPSTVGDFWKMIDACKVTHIVMLCDNVEMGRPKCERYIPKTPGEQLQVQGGYRITVSHKAGKPEIVVERTFTSTKLLLHCPNGAVKKIRHYHYRSWPDRSTPPVTDMLGLLRILSRTRTNTAEQHTVVHCSAGIGRTGTFVAIEMCLHQLLGDPAKNLDLVEIGKKIRDQRPGSIQVELQFVMVAVGVFEYGRMIGFIKNQQILVEVEKFISEYDRISHLGEDESPFAAPPPPPVAIPSKPSGAQEKTAPLLSVKSEASTLSSAASTMSTASVAEKTGPLLSIRQDSTASQASCVESTMSTASVQQKTGPLLSVRQDSAVSQVSCAASTMSAASVAQKTGPLLSVRQDSSVSQASTMSNAASTMSTASVAQKTGPLLSVRQPESTMSEASSSVASVVKTGPLLSIRQDSTISEVNSGVAASTMSNAASTMSNASSAMSVAQKTGPLLSVRTISSEPKTAKMLFSTPAIPVKTAAPPVLANPSGATPQPPLPPFPHRR